MISTIVDDSIQLQDEEMSLDSIGSVPLATMEVPSTPVSKYTCMLHLTKLM